MEFKDWAVILIFLGVSFLGIRMYDQHVSILTERCQGYYGKDARVYISSTHAVPQCIDTEGIKILPQD